MKTKKTLFVVLSVIVLLAMSVSFATAQGPLPDDPNGDDVVVTDVSSSAMSDSFTIQGRLTNAAGNPLEGSYSVRFNIYDASSGGTLLCGDTDTVTVTNGLFNFSMQYCTDADLTGDPIYLGIKVGTDDEMTPRTAINPVPYARRAENLVAGAAIQGADSYLFVPAAHLIKNMSGDTTRWDVDYTEVEIFRGATAGGKTVMVPITIPAVLYGQNVRISAMRVYYKVAGTAYISATRLYKATDVDSHETLINDGTDRTSTTASAYSLTPDALYDDLSSTAGILMAEFSLSFSNDTDAVTIAGIRLTLDHTP